MESKYKEQMDLQQKELDSLRKKETCEREDHWNRHIAGLIADHNKAFTDVKEFVNLMKHDLDTSKSLKV